MYLQQVIIIAGFIIYNLNIKKISKVFEMKTPKHFLFTALVNFSGKKC